MPQTGYYLQHLLESRQVVTPDVWEVRATIERFTFRGEKYAHWPSTLTIEGNHKVHVNAIQIETLLPVHLDADKIIIHQVGCIRVFERFVRHHVAPVACCITNAEENGVFLFTVFF